MATIHTRAHTHFVAPLNTPCSPHPVHYMRNRQSYTATGPIHNHPVIHTEEHCECTRTTVVPWSRANIQQEGKNCLGNKCTNLEAFKTSQTVCDQCIGRCEGLYKMQWERQGDYAVIHTATLHYLFPCLLRRSFFISIHSLLFGGTFVLPWRLSSLLNNTIQT